MKLRIRTPLALAVLTAAASLAACSDDDDPTGGGDEEAPLTAEVEMDDDFFSPQSVRVRAGGTVTWVNVGETDHTTTSEDGTWDETMSPGDTFQETFETPGEFDYECTIHDGMIGTVTVEEE